MMRDMDRAQAQYDAMEPPDYYADATDDEADPDDERERQDEWQ